NTNNISVTPPAAVTIDWTIVPDSRPAPGRCQDIFCQRRFACRPLVVTRRFGAELRYWNCGILQRVPRLELLTVGEAFQDLIFAGLPHMPRNGEEVRTARFVSTIGGGAVITAAAGARLGLRTAVISGLSRDASRALRRERIRVVNVKRPAEAHAVTV